MPRAETGEDHLVITDPHVLRALAHPARMRVVDELYQGRVRTSSQLAELTGLTASAMSYHLRALERFGIVRRAESDDARERPWRAAAKGFSWSGRDGGEAATDSLVGLYLDRLGRDLSTWRAQEPVDPDDDWHDGSLVDRGFPWLTPDELHDLNRRLQELVRPYAGRSERAHPDGARPTAYLFATTPLAGDAPPADPTPERA